jgi:hypothetical protein
MRSAFGMLSMIKLDDGPFDQAVKIHGVRAGQVQHISSARKAAEWLNEWPMKIDTAKACCTQSLPGGSGGSAQGGCRPKGISRSGRRGRHPDRG